MKIRPGLFAVNLCLSLYLFLLSPAFADNQKVALVIGNSNYATAPLQNPVNDATDMAAALRNLGFDVTLKTDAGQRTMEKAIRRFGKQLRSGGVGLFYYAGHGLQVRGSNYLIPIGAEIESEGDVRYEAVDAGLVLAKMEDAGNGLNIVILDACRNNPFARSFRSAERGLAKMDAPTGSILAYATAPGSVAADGTGRNGLYTAMLLKHMDAPGLEIGRLFREVRKDVVHASSSKQTPWESSSLMGDFYFRAERGIAVAAKTSSAAKPARPAAGASTGKSRSKGFETRELRYAASLVKRGQNPAARKIVAGLLKSDDDTVQSEAMYAQVVWDFAQNDRDAFEKLKAYYPDFKWLAKAEQAVVEREARRNLKVVQEKQLQTEMMGRMVGSWYGDQVRNGKILDKDYDRVRWLRIFHPDGSAEITFRYYQNEALVSETWIKNRWGHSGNTFLTECQSKRRAGQNVKCDTRYEYELTTVSDAQLTYTSKSSGRSYTTRRVAPNFTLP